MSNALRRLLEGVPVDAPPLVLTKGDQLALLGLARQALCWQLGHGVAWQPELATLPAPLHQVGACFVTLEHPTSGLRGCVGGFHRRPLGLHVPERAIAAAADRRFAQRPVALAELAEITIKLSILTPPRPLVFHTPQELIEGLRPTVDGVVLITALGGATFLPVVWRQLPRAEDFLARLCHKHGAPGDLWRRDTPNVAVYTFQTLDFAEPRPGGRFVGPKGATVGAGVGYRWGSYDTPQGDAPRGPGPPLGPGAGGGWGARGVWAPG
ncbi:MAG: AmmeMemoRadiSam system protein A, partial [Candidatus Competibacterales bacterium]